MRTYLFNTVTTENSSDFWIDRNIVSEFKVQANNFDEAKQKYFEFVENNAYITISKTQQRKANKMYIDTKEGKSIQTGFVLSVVQRLILTINIRKDTFLCGVRLTNYITHFND